MSKINDTLFQNFWKLSTRVQQLQQQIQTQSVSADIRKSLHEQIEGLQNTLEKLREEAMQTQKQVVKQFDEMENQIISLYRVVEERFENYEITLISEEALALSHSLESKTMAKVAKQINELRHNIHFLFAHRRPSIQHRKIVNIILKILEHGEKQLKENQGDARLICLLKILLQEAVLQAEKALDPLEGELAMDLYEVADLIYKKNKHEARFKLNFIYARLTSTQQNRIDSAKDDDELLSAILEIADGDPCLEWAASQKRGSIIHTLDCHQISV